MQLYPVELQRACCVQIIKLCLGRRQTAERDDDDDDDFDSDGTVRRREKRCEVFAEGERKGKQ